MRMFDISDVLSVTTGRLVSKRHIEGVYDILNFLTGDNLFTHQLGRAMTECEPWLKSQFPTLMKDHPLMVGLLSELDSNLASVPKDAEKIAPVITRWIESVMLAAKLPEQLPVYELGADMHTRIDPIEELEAMVGKDRIIVVEHPE